eukprot:9487082-Pyramimonas_sp.AAC.2
MLASVRIDLPMERRQGGRSFHTMAMGGSPCLNERPSSSTSRETCKAEPQSSHTWPPFRDSVLHNADDPVSTTSTTLPPTDEDCHPSGMTSNASDACNLSDLSRTSSTDSLSLGSQSSTSAESNELAKNADVQSHPLTLSHPTSSSSGYFALRRRLSLQVSSSPLPPHPRYPISLPNLVDSIRAEFNQKALN